MHTKNHSTWRDGVYYIYREMMKTPDHELLERVIGNERHLSFPPQTTIWENPTIEEPFPFIEQPFLS